MIGTTATVYLADRYSLALSAGFLLLSTNHRFREELPVDMKKAKFSTVFLWPCILSF